MRRTTRGGGGSGRRGGFGSALHRWLIAAEAVLVLGVAKDFLWKRILASDLPRWGQVVLVMATTVGLFGGLFLVLRGIATRGVKSTHRAAQGLPMIAPTLVLHALLLAVLYVLYARM